MTAIKTMGADFSSVRHRTRLFARSLCLGLAAACLVTLPAVAQALALPTADSSAVSSQTQPTTLSPARANFRDLAAPKDVRQAADWVVDSGDNHNLPFVIVEKPAAKVFVFDAHGQILGAAPALVGLAPGDDSVPGIGDKPLSAIGPADRTTPAGRFVASLGHDLGVKDVLWVDYADAISLHRVVTSNPREHRLQRLATPTPLDNRISYGCINVPAKFFDQFVEPTFKALGGIVYILPEIKSARDVFPTYYDVDDRPRLLAVSLSGSAP